METEAGLLPRSKDEVEHWDYREDLGECILVAKASNS